MKLTNNDNIPSFMVKAVEYWSTQHKSEATYSVTELLDAPRRSQLMSQHADEVQEDVSSRIWSLLGSATHKVIESALDADDDDSLVSEKRMFGEIDGVTFSGQCDVYDKSSKTIYDLKTASVWEIINGIREEREMQLNCYAYLGRQEGWEVDNIAAVFILRDWSKMKATTEQNYPKSQVLVHSLRMWSKEEAEAFLRKRIALHEAAKVTLPYCTPEEQWRRPDKFAVMANGRKSALRVLDSAQEAQRWMATNKKGNSIVQRTGGAVRCESYCAVNTFCTQFQSMVK